jgi:hypothetical protein
VYSVPSFNAEHLKAAKIDKRPGNPKTFSTPIRILAHKICSVSLAMEDHGQWDVLRSQAASTASFEIQLEDESLFTWLLQILCFHGLF